MENASDKLGNSTDEQDALRVIALWAAEFAEEALPVFEDTYPDDARPREAVEAAREFGKGKKRDKHLRMIALGALKAGKGADEPSRYAAQAATLAAAVAYTHTDLQTGLQGVRQARHVLGPVAYAALALELATGGGFDIGNGVIQRAIGSAPLEARYILEHMPPQPKKETRLDVLFADLEAGLRANA